MIDEFKNFDQFRMKVKTYFYLLFLINLFILYHTVPKVPVVTVIDLELKEATAMELREVVQSVVVKRVLYNY